jgi:3'(2'),5'-bisphosphate nucleotidase
MTVSISPPQLSALLAAVFAAGRLILEVRAKGATKMTKGDGSPVTEADQGAEEILLTVLGAQFPDIPVIAEEAAAAGKLPQIEDRFFLVDPLDGTKEFIRGGSDFTVNIGLIENKVPVFGIVYAPFDGRLFVGGKEGAWTANVDCQSKSPKVGAHKQIHVRVPDLANLSAVASRSHRDEQTNAWLSEHGIPDIVSAGSSIKFCLLAAGEADVYPRFGPTMEWDTAAAHAVLVAAGGKLTRIDGSAFTYGRANQVKPYLNPGFIAWGGWRGA